MNYRKLSKYNKSQIDRAGLQWDLNIINEFRYDHENMSKEFLLICSDFEDILFSARRLKRTPSIIKKIERSRRNRNTIRLSAMQDVCGCRCVFETINDIKLFMKHIKWKLKDFKQKSIYNYIDRKNNPKWPKTDWYRGIHIIYEYVGSNENWRWLFIELQLRTILQHYWATAVEMIDLMQESKIKEGEWKELFRDFFKRASIVFENLEGMKTSNNKKAKNKLIKILQEENILKILQKRVVQYGYLGFFWNNSISIQWDTILEITIKNNNLHIIPYTDKTPLELKQIYLELETKYRWNPNKDIVYLSSDEIENAYPNYIGNAEEFIKILSSEL